MYISHMVGQIYFNKINLYETLFGLQELLRKKIPDKKAERNTRDRILMMINTKAIIKKLTLKEKYFFTHLDEYDIMMMNFQFKI